MFNVLKCSSFKFILPKIYLICRHFAHCLGWPIFPIFCWQNSRIPNREFSQAKSHLVESSAKLQSQPEQTSALLHLRSKEFQKIHLSCMPQHRETSKYTLVYIEMYHRKVITFLKGPVTFIKALTWMWSLNLFYTILVNMDCGNKSMLIW